MKLRRALSTCLLLLGVALHLFGGWKGSTLHTETIWKVGQLLLPALVLGLAWFLRRDLEPLFVVGVGTLVPFGVAVVGRLQDFAWGGGIGNVEFHEGIALVFGAAAGLGLLGGLRLPFHGPRPFDPWIGGLLFVVALWWTWISAAFFVASLRESHVLVGNEAPFALTLTAVAIFGLAATLQLLRRGRRRLGALAAAVAIVVVAATAARLAPGLATSTELLREARPLLASRTGEPRPMDRVTLRLLVHDEELVEVRREIYRPHELEDLLSLWRERAPELTVLVDVTSRTSLQALLRTLERLVEHERVALRLTIADLVEGLDRLRETGRGDCRLLVPKVR